MQTSSKRFAGRVRDHAEGHEAGRIAFRMALAREPDHEEGERLRQFLDDNTLESLCLSLLNINEFVYLQ